MPDGNIFQIFGGMMRWFSFSILLFVTLVVQVGLAQLFGLGPQRVTPDLFLLLAVVLAFRGQRDQAMVAGWLLGLAKDLSSQAPLGSYAFVFGLMTWAVIRGREVFYGEHPITLIIITFLSSFAVEQLVLMICVYKGVFASEDCGGLSVIIMFSALLTAGLAPYGQWIVMRFHRQLGLPRRRTYGR